MPNPFEDQLANAVVNTLRQHLRLVIVTATMTDQLTGEEVAWIEAMARDGQIYRVSGGTQYEAAIALAELLDFDLMDS